MPRGVPRRGPRRFVRSADGGILDTLVQHRDRLMAERDAVESQIAAIENALSAISGAPRAGGPRRFGGGMGGGGAARGRGRGRGRHGPREGSLKQYISKVMSGRGPMAVKDITEAVRRAGYPTKNRTLAKSVGVALTQITGVRKLGRGRFQAS